MELKELMKKENLSENDIIGAAKVIAKVCGNIGCPYCPLYFRKECHAKDMTSQFEGEALNRFRSLLYSNHMKKVAELLGVKFNEAFHVSYGDGKGSMACYLDETGLHLSGMMYLTKSELLQDLLNGKAHIEKRRQNDEIKRDYEEAGNIRGLHH